MNEPFYVYTDGSCLKHSYGGWAWSLIHRGIRLHRASGSQMNTTNQCMELTAAHHALCFATDHFTPESHYIFMSDSKYVINGITEWSQNWIKNGFRTARGSPVEHADLWRSVLFYHKPDFKWQWIKGHSGNAFHDEVDKAARSEAQKLMEFHQNLNVDK